MSAGRALTPYVGVIGVGDVPADGELAQTAYAVGRALAGRGALVVCGGLGGVMAAACQGARSAGGTTLGLLPGLARAAANPWVDIVVPTGLGEARNVLVIRSADAVVAIGGGWGTLSEIALAVRAGVPVVGVHTWDPVPPGADTGPVEALADPVAAADRAFELAAARGSRRK